MIINYPTGLYATILPKKPEDGGNVTYTISNQTPPRSNLLFPKVPLGLVEKRRFVPTIDLVERRLSLGNLIFTVSRATGNDVGNNSRQFEIGQILEFEETTGPATDPMLVGPVTEVRHDLNVLDYEQMGLSDEDEQIIAEQTLVAQNQLSDRLNELKRLRANAEQSIKVSQKLMNELNRTIDALRVTLTSGAGTAVTDSTEGALIEPLLVKLEAKLAVATAERDVAVTDANEYAAESAVVIDQLRTVSVLVK